MLQVSQAVLPFQPKYQFAHPGNYSFSLSEKAFSRSKYPKKTFYLILKKEALVQRICFVQSWKTQIAARCAHTWTQDLKVTHSLSCAIHRCSSALISCGCSMPWERRSDPGLPHFNSFVNRSVLSEALQPLNNIEWFWSRSGSTFRSPRKLLINTTQSNISGSKYPTNTSYTFEIKSLVDTISIIHSVSSYFVH